MTQINNITVSNHAQTNQNGKASVSASEKINLNQDKTGLSFGNNSSSLDGIKVPGSDVHLRQSLTQAVANVTLTLSLFSSLLGHWLGNSNNKVIEKEREMAIFKAAKNGKDCESAKKTATETVKAIEKKLPHKPGTIKALFTFSIITGVASILLNAIYIMSRIAGKKQDKVDLKLKVNGNPDSITHVTSKAG